MVYSVVKFALVVPTCLASLLLSPDLFWMFSMTETNSELVPIFELAVSRIGLISSRTRTHVFRDSSVFTPLLTMVFTSISEGGTGAAGEKGLFSMLWRGGKGRGFGSVFLASFGGVVFRTSEAIWSSFCWCFMMRVFSSSIIGELRPLLAGELFWEVSVDLSQVQKRSWWRYQHYIHYKLAKIVVCTWYLINDVF